MQAIDDIFHVLQLYLHV